MFVGHYAAGLFWSALVYAVFRWIVVKRKRVALAIFALVAYILFAAIAFWLDKKRILGRTRGRDDSWHLVRGARRPYDFAFVEF
jgi:hypothetical protein